MKPAQVIAFEKERAERELLARAGETIQMIANKYSGETGESISSIAFEFIDVTEFGSAEKRTIVARVSVRT